MLSRLLFSYCNGILAMGSRKILVQDDLWDVSRYATTGDRFKDSMRITNGDAVLATTSETLADGSRGPQTRFIPVIPT